MPARKIARSVHEAARDKARNRQDQGLGRLTGQRKKVEMLFAQPITLHRILRRRSGFDIRLDEEIGDASDGGPETVDRSLGCFAQHGFELGKGVLDRIEVRL
jgi:hypothetical protein